MNYTPTTLKSWQDAFNILYSEEIYYTNKENEKVNTSLRTQSQAIEAIRNGQYIVVSVGANGDFSMSASPMPQSSATAARAECQRLARINPGKLFAFLKFSGAEMIPTNTMSI